MASLRRTPTARAVIAAAPLMVVGALLLSGCASPAPIPNVEGSTPPPRMLYTPDTLLGKPKSVSRAMINSAESHLDQLKRQVGQPTSAIGWAYGDETQDAEVLLVSGASGTVADPTEGVDSALRPYPVRNVESVDAGKLGGEARCGQGRTEAGNYATICAWADKETIGVVIFLSLRPQADRTADFLKVRGQLVRPAV